MSTPRIFCFALSTRNFFGVELGAVFVKIPRMPKGLEHSDKDKKSTRWVKVKIPRMPKGVEHHSSGMPCGAKSIVKIPRMPKVMLSTEKPSECLYGNLVKIPRMPKGVEHSTGARLWDPQSRENS